MTVVYVRTLTGRVVNIEITMESTVRDLKRRYHDLEGIPVDQQRLLFSGVQLEDNRTLSSYNIESGGNIFSVLRLRKPVIYILPPRPIDVSVQLTLTPDWTFSVLYPITTIKQDCPGDRVVWNVHAAIDGTLTDKNSGREVSYVYWEAM